jgi:hypothetical protein
VFLAQVSFLPWCPNPPEAIEEQAHITTSLRGTLILHLAKTLDYIDHVSHVGMSAMRVECWCAAVRDGVRRIARNRAVIPDPWALSLRTNEPDDKWLDFDNDSPVGQPNGIVSRNLLLLTYTGVHCVIQAGCELFRRVVAESPSRPVATSQSRDCPLAPWRLPRNSQRPHLKLLWHDVLVLSNTPTRLI